MGRASTWSPTRDAERRRGGAVLQAVLERITYVNEETGYTMPGPPRTARVRIW
jgi:hypothetical protein